MIKQALIALLLATSSAAVFAAPGDANGVAQHKQRLAQQQTQQTVSNQQAR
ncbi:hypothetical protein QU481_12215 [Crenobacter sp. SG2303]|uniref:Uncharacterized protein n=1 Tax=Crenobacter oryzisoli TaxID=3056844 RepID=A0ABT7XQ05_9NEIS|nr:MULTISPECIES: hypothetical protein [unclassified Crenobacter]MDN0075654.1 hypothetical protein [Crenobacter sp. SG2303]MDN0083762.1 hypothetical protein [Crenobacter sp. SG2305]